MNVGDKAPDFTLRDQRGNEVRMSEAAAGGILVVFFYPKDGSPVCTREACSFRDNYREFQKYNATVLGISSDGLEAHQKFAEDNHLSFPLLTDDGGRVRKLWGVPATLGVLPGRSTYVIDSSGVVRNIFSSQLDAAKHVSTALEAVRKLDAMKNLPG